MSEKSELLSGRCTGVLVQDVEDFLELVESEHKARKIENDQFSC